MQTETEAYDHKLARRIQDTSSQIEALTLELANLRRTAPAIAAQKYREESAVEDQTWKDRLVVESERQLDEARRTDIAVSGLERSEDMHRTYSQGTECLVDAKDGIGATIARLEKARDVVGYLQGRQ